MTHLTNKPDQANVFAISSHHSATRIAFLGVFCLTLAACTGRADVITQDDSADYHSARSLPPLIKPGDNRANTSQQEPNTQPMPSQRQSSAQSESNDIAPSPTTDEPSVPVADTAESSIVLKGTVSEINARVERVSDATARLIINTEYEAAWDFVSENLKNSDITVHARNKSAGRFSIGCGDMESVTTTKKGGWSIFKRKSEELEHCALQLVSSRDHTDVQVLNRSGSEVGVDAAEDIFNRLINN